MKKIDCIGQYVLVNLLRICSEKWYNQTNDKLLIYCVWHLQYISASNCKRAFFIAK